MGDLTRNLSRSEFACQCGCGFDTVDTELVDTLQEVVDHFILCDGVDVSITITGPNRCVNHNEKVQKRYNLNYTPYSSLTQHMSARAVDFKLFDRRTKLQIDPDRVSHHLEVKYPQCFGIGRYNNRTHLDTRTNGPARWDNRG